MQKINEALLKLEDYISKSEYKGYDPYDFLNSKIDFNNLSLKLQFIFTQLSKRSPINFRPLLKIPINYNTKGMGLFLNAYSTLYKLNHDDNIKKQAEYLFNWINSNTTKSSSELTWGFDYPYANRTGNVEKGFPTIIHHSYVLKGLAKYYEVFNDEKALELIKRGDKFIINSLPLKSYNSGKCYGYHPGAQGCCYNASLHAAESLALIDKISNSEKYSSLVFELVKYIILKQKSNGVWYYGHDEINVKKETNQIDFHQGFILESLYNINKYTVGNFSNIILPSISLGLKYYANKQFDKKGRSFYRFPQKYPIDIHAQAQGIITFSLLNEFNIEYRDLATKILFWTINNMQNKNGSFSYQKYPFFTIKTPHIRWGQAWMLVAMSTYFENVN